MRLSEELASASFLLLEREQHEFDRQWVNGVKAAWKQLYKERTSYPGRVARTRVKKVSPKRDHNAVQKAANASLTYLKRVKKFLQDLQQDLLINKGFWQPTRGKPMGILAKDKSTLVRALHNAIAAIDTTWEPKRYGHRDFLPYPWDERYGLYSFGGATEAKLDISDMNDVLSGLAARASEPVKKADGILTRGVWKTLNGILEKYAGDKGTDADNSWSINKGTHPTELSIGRARIKFEDTPVDPMGLDRKKQKAHGRKKWVYPDERKGVVKALIQTQALLNKRGVGDQIWYGDIYVRPHARGYAFKDAKGKARRAGADYNPVTDDVRVFGSHNASNVGLIVHELGHRYYFKVMTQKDRDNFDRWYEQVKATSEYGASSTVEDFAEVFMEYVLGKMKLDQDQIQRFESVLKGKMIHDEPATTSELPPENIVKWAGTTVAFVDKTPGGGWSRTLDALKQIKGKGYARKIERLWRHGVVVRDPRPGYPPADFDQRAGVLTIHAATPPSARTTLGNIALAFYHSSFVTPKMRKAWEELWSSRLRGGNVGADAAARRFGFELSGLINGKDHDPKTLHYLLWILGDQDQPPSVDKMKDEPFTVPTPRQMHQRSRMKMVGMEWRKGPLSSALVEALCS